MLDDDGITITLPTESLNSPWVVWIGVIVTCLLLVSIAAPRVFGPISQVISDWVAQKRRMGAEREDAMLADMSEQLAYIERVAAARLRDIVERDRALVIHQEWDWRRLRDPECMANAQDDPMPPLWPERRAVDPDHLTQPRSTLGGET